MHRGRRARVATSTAAASLALVVALHVVLAPSPVAVAQPDPPLVVDGAPRDGELRVDPAIQQVDAGSATWVVTNGGGTPLTLELAVHDVVVDDGDVVVGGRRAAGGLSADTLRLDPGEAARVPAALPEGTGPDLLALVATARDADPETSVTGLALVDATHRVAATVESVDREGFHVRLRGEGPAVVDVALRLTAWPGLVRSEQVIEDVVVPGDGRVLDVPLDGALVGRVTLAVATSGTEEVASAVRWWWPPAWVATLAVALLAVTGWALARVLRRGRPPG